MATTKKTYHEGAEAERKAFKAYLKRRPEYWTAKGLMPIPDILNWIAGRCDRYKKRKGGL